MPLARFHRSIRFDSEPSSRIELMGGAKNVMEDLEVDYDFPSPPHVAQAWALRKEEGEKGTLILAPGPVVCGDDVLLT